MWVSSPGSQSPLLVPIITPDRGEKPMLVSRAPASPVTLAARLQPAPRWQLTSLACSPSTLVTLLTT